MTILRKIVERHEVLEGLRRDDLRPLDRALHEERKFPYTALELERAWEVLVDAFPGAEQRHPRYQAAALIAWHRALRGLADETARETLLRAIPPLGPSTRKEQRAELKKYYPSPEAARIHLEWARERLQRMHAAVTPRFAAAHVHTRDHEHELLRKLAKSRPERKKLIDRVYAQSRQRKVARELLENHNGAFNLLDGHLYLLLKRAEERRGK